MHHGPSDAINFRRSGLSIVFKAKSHQWVEQCHDLGGPGWETPLVPGHNGLRRKGRRQEVTDTMGKMTCSLRQTLGKVGGVQQPKGREAIARVIWKLSGPSRPNGARLYSRSFRARDQFEVQKGVGQCWVICPQWTEPHPWKPHQKDWSLSWGEGLVESACLKNWVSYGFNPRGIVGYPQATDMPLSERMRQKVNALDREPGERRML